MVTLTMMTKKKTRFEPASVEQYEALVELVYFLDYFSLKTAWKTRLHIVTRHGEYWERCNRCDQPLGEHDEPCYLDRVDEDYYRDR